MTTAAVRARLQSTGVPHDTLSQRAGVFALRRGFYYTSGNTAAKLAEGVRVALPTAHLLKVGEVWLPFRGGAPVARQSHWFVKFTVAE